MKKRLEQYKQEVEQELENILRYWTNHTQDEANGGFVGRIDHDETIHPEAPKGSVLNSRILWSFSAAYRFTQKKEYLAVAERAFRYLVDHFIDNEYGGVFWTVDHKGQPLDTKKQVYALAFAIYGLSEYALATGDAAAKYAAKHLYHAIVNNGYEPQHGGYIEALTRDWQEMGDLRLSAKDANERKSMNTHLHVLEGFANLYRIWSDAGLKEKIRELIRLFLDHMISAKTAHLLLFFDDAWQSKFNLVSYGHDIEAAWLIQEAAEVIGDEALLQTVKERSVLLAAAAAEGLDSDGGLWYEYEADEDHLVREKHWWPQAEAMIGFFNAWQLTGDESQLNQSLSSWKFVKQSLLDTQGEWVWGINGDGSVMTHEDKVGVWKCPYHNSRACIEISRRIAALLPEIAGQPSETPANNQSAI